MVRRVGAAWALPHSSSGCSSGGRRSLEMMEVLLLLLLLPRVVDRSGRHRLGLDPEDSLRVVE